MLGLEPRRRICVTAAATCGDLVVTRSWRFSALQLNELKRGCHEITIAKASLVFKDGVRPFTGLAASANWVREPLNVGDTLFLVFGVCRHTSLDGDDTGGWVTILSRHGKWGGRYHGHVVSSNGRDRGLDHEFRGIHRPEHVGNLHSGRHKRRRRNSERIRSRHDRASDFPGRRHLHGRWQHGHSASRPHSNTAS